MYNHHIRDMAKIAAKCKGAEEIEEALREYWTDRIAVSWCVSDVTERAEQMGREVTDDEARDVLSSLVSGFDANLGINWEVIDTHTDWVLEDKKFEDR